MFDNCPVRRTALVQLLHLSGRYHVPFHHHLAHGNPAALTSAMVDGALVAVGDDTQAEQALIANLRSQLGRRPILAYALNARSHGVFRPFTEVGGANHEKHRLDVCFEPFADSAVLVESLHAQLIALHSKDIGVCNLAVLSPREQQIFGLLGAGRSYKAMATELGISLNTVHTHAKRIRAKLQLPENGKLLALAVQANLRACRP